MSDDLHKLALDIGERLRYLQEIGVDSMNVELSERSMPAVVQDVQSVAVQVAPPPEMRVALPTSEPQAERRPAGSRLASLPSLSNRKTVPFFDKYNPPDGQKPVMPDQQVQPEVPRSVPPTTDTVPAMPEPIETIEQVRAEIGPDCTRCKLSQLGRTQVVNSVGNLNADLMFVGEAPGADEDIQGQPFVGRAGQLLTDIIEKGLQIPRQEVFIGNINRCRPPKNRAPEPDEASICRKFLIREIAVVRPKVIVVLGATAAHNLLDTRVPISKLRGEFQDYMGTKVMPTFHPSYLLRDPHKKREVWEDMKKVRDYINAMSQ